MSGLPTTASGSASTADSDAQEAGNRESAGAPAPPPVRFIAYGLPVPQGSTRAFVVKGRAVTTSASKGLRPWRDTLASAARLAMQENGLAVLTGPLAVEAVFTMPRPKSRPKSDRWPDRRPDLDKLARGLLDGITGPVCADDAQVCHLSVTKEYVGDPLSLLEEPGVLVSVRVMTA